MADLSPGGFWGNLDALTITTVPGSPAFLCPVLIFEGITGIIICRWFPLWDYFLGVCITFDWGFEEKLKHMDPV